MLCGALACGDDAHPPETSDADDAGRDAASGSNAGTGGNPGANDAATPADAGRDAASSPDANDSVSVDAGDPMPLDAGGAAGAIAPVPDEDASPGVDDDDAGEPPPGGDLCVTPWGWETPLGTAHPVPFQQGTYAPLDFQLVAAEYAPALERFVGVSSNPAALRVFDASGAVELAVALPAAPTALSVTPGGERAAVGHASAISLVDLTSGDVTTHAFPAGAYDLADGGGAFVYATPRGSDGSGHTAALYSVAVSTGAITPGTSGLSSGLSEWLALAPDGNGLYMTGGIYELARFDVSAGPAVFERRVSTSAGCGEPVVFADGQYLFDTGCGSVHRLGEDVPPEGTYKTSPPISTVVIAAAHGAARGELALLLDKEGPGLATPEEIKRLMLAQVHVYDDQFLGWRRSATLPDYEEGGQEVPLWGRWLSYSNDGSALYVIAETPSDSALPRRTAIVTLPGELALDPAAPALDDGGDYHLLQASVIDAEYSEQLEQIVLVSGSPARLTVLDPATQTQRDVALPRAPMDLILDPAGARALVVYDGWLEYYSLEPLALLRTIDLYAHPAYTGLDGQERAYMVRGGRDTVIIDLRDGSIQTFVNMRRDGIGRYAPAEQAFRYASAYQLHYTAVDDGMLGPTVTSVLDHHPCWEWWPASDGRVFTACGRVFSGGPDPRYRGTIRGFEESTVARFDFIAHLDQSAASGLVAFVPSDRGGPGVAREVLLHEDRFYAARGDVRLPAFSVAGMPVVAHPRYVFFTPDGQRLDVLAQADRAAGLARDFALISFDVTNAAPCPEPPVVRTATSGSQLGRASLVPLAFDVADAAFSEALDRLVVVSSDPPRLHLVDPQTGTASASLDLPLAPTRVVLEPGGLGAVVGHDAWLSRVALAPLAMSAFYELSANPWSIAIEAGHAYVVPDRDQATSLRVLELATGEELRSAITRAASTVYVSPDGQSLLLGAPENSAPGRVRRMSIAQAHTPPMDPNDIVERSTDVIDDGGYTLWFAEDGARLFSTYGGIFDISDPQAASFARLGTLQGSAGVRTLDHSQSAGRVAVVERRYMRDLEDDVVFYDDATYAQLERISLPSFATATGNVPTHGLHLFFSADGSETYVLVEAAGDEPLTARFGLVRMSTEP